MKALEFLNQEGPVVNEIRKLESRLWRRTRKDDMKTLMFTSALQGEGKSTTAALFAAAAALHRSRRILLVDLDFRRPNLHSHFQVEPSCGFTDYLLGKNGLDQAVCSTEISNLWVVPGAEAGDLDPDQLLNSPHLSDAVDVFRERFDLVVLDVPALIPVADAAALIPLADGILLVVMAGVSTRHHLTRARDICLGMDGNLLGLVVGNIQEAAPEYLDGSYYARLGGGETKGKRPETDTGRT